MAERGLRVLEADKTFFGKITNTITKLLIPTVCFVFRVNR